MTIRDKAADTAYRARATRLAHRALPITTRQPTLWDRFTAWLNSPANWF